MTCDLSQHVNTININSDKNKPSTFDIFAIIINIFEILKIRNRRRWNLLDIKNVNLAIFEKNLPLISLSAQIPCFQFLL